MKRINFHLLAGLAIIGIGALATYKSSADKIPPYTVLFENDKRFVLYVAARHETSSSSDTFALIKDSITDFSPDLVIVEGIENDLGISPPSIIKHIETRCLETWRCGEPLYAAYLYRTFFKNWMWAVPKPRG